MASGFLPNLNSKTGSPEWLHTHFPQETASHRSLLPILEVYSRTDKVCVRLYNSIFSQLNGRKIEVATYFLSFFFLITYLQHF